MKNLIYILGFLLLTSCSGAKELVYYQVTLETGNLKYDDLVVNQLYEKKENQCGALFLDDKKLTVINNFDTSATFINLQYKYEKDETGIHDTYTFEDVFLKKKENYKVLSPLRDGAPVLEFKKGEIVILDEMVNLFLRDGAKVYVRADKDKNGNEFYETYTVIKTTLTSVNYDKYSFPCE